jgi:NTP pyrophosphatase (non-canonical NTP hydrolase)
MTMPDSTSMRDVAAQIVVMLRRNGFPAEGAADRQMLVMAEETGELVGAYRRWTGQARRRGSFEDVCAELADVVITAWVTAAELGIDLDAAVAAKLAVVFERGWRELPGVTR